MPSFVNTFEGERHKCSFKVDPISTTEERETLKVAAILSHPKLGRGADPEVPLYRTPEWMGHTF